MLHCNRLLEKEEKSQFSPYVFFMYGYVKEDLHIYRNII